MHVTLWPTVTTTTGTYGEIDWTEIVTLVSTPIVAGEKNNLQGWSPVRCAGNTRSDASVESVSLVVLDDDATHLPLERVCELWSPFAGLIHTTHSHTTESPKYRIILRTTRDMTPAEHARVWAFAREHAAKHAQILDDSTRNPSRFWYAPGHRPGAPYEWRALPGAALDVDAILALAPVAPAPPPTTTAPGASTTPVTGPGAAPTADRRAAAARLLAGAWPSLGTGQRHKAKCALAGALYRDGWSLDDAIAFRREIYADVDSPDGGEGGKDEVSTYARADTHNLTGWSTLAQFVDPGVVSAARGLLSFDGLAAAHARLERQAELDGAVAALPADVPLPAFPVDELPPVLRTFVLAQALFTEVPVDLPAMFALGACAAAIAGKVDLEVRPGYVEPLNLFVVVGAKTGERKSPIHAACFGPLTEIERQKAEASAPLIAKAKAQRDAKQRLLLKRQSEFAGVRREDAPLERANNSMKPGGVAIEKEIADLAVEIERLKVPAVPKLLVGDVTVEKLASIMGEQNGRLCLASDEGTILSIAAGRYAKDGRSSFDVLLQGYSGTPIRVDRQSSDRPPVFVRRPRLTICIAVQPEVIEKLSKDETMRSQGLLARFVYAIPTSMVGRRPVAGRSMPQQERIGYEQIVRALASLPGPEESGCDEIPRIRLSPEAHDLHLTLQRELEPRLDPKTGDLAEIGDWAAKFAGNVARVAGVLHCVQYGPTGEVNAATMASAIRIGEYLLAHALAAYGSMGKAAIERDADAVIGWLRQKPRPSFTMRDLQRLGPSAIRSDKKRLVDALEYLSDRGQLRANGNVWSAVS